MSRPKKPEFDAIWQDRDIRFDVDASAYETTKLYRELKMRGSIIENDQLKLLPLEEQYSRIEGVWNLSSDQSGEYVLGFRVDPGERLEEVTKEIHSLCRTYIMKPEFGVEFVKERTNSSASAKVEVVEPVEDDICIDSTNGRPDAFAAYFSDGGRTDRDRGPVYSEELGVAIEKLKEGFTLQDLWEINVD